MSSYHLVEVESNKEDGHVSFPLMLMIVNVWIVFANALLKSLILSFSKISGVGFFVLAMLGPFTVGVLLLGV